MKRKLELVGLSVVLALLFVFFLTTGAFAQRNELFIPLAVESEEVKLGNYAEIQPTDCERLGLALSRHYFPNGTSIFDIAKQYHMFAIEIRDLNRDFVPNLVIDSMTGQSRVCLYKTYNVSAFPGYAQSDKDLIINWKEGVPNWQDNLWSDSPEVSASQVQTDTYTVLFGLIALDTAWGAPVVGHIELGGKTIGQIVKGIPSNAVRFMSNAVSGFVLLDAFYNRISTATTLGVEYSATVLSENGAGVFYGTQETEWAYFGCFSNGTDIYEDLMSRSEAIRMYTTGSGTEACVISRVPLEGEMGGLLYRFEVLNATALRKVAERQVHPDGPLTVDDIKIIADAVDAWYRMNDEDRNNDPIVPPPVEGGECNRLSDESHLVQEAVMTTIADLEAMLRNAPVDELHSYSRLMDFANWAQFEFVELDLADRYQGTRPRNSGFHMAHLTSEPLNTSTTPDGTVEVVCFGSESNFVWIIDSMKGRLRTGVTSTIWEAVDYIRPYQYEYAD